MQENIQELWSEQCLDRTKDEILMAIARDGRLTTKTALSARQRYFYYKKIDDGEAPIILEIVRNALRTQNTRIKEKIES